MPSSSTRARGSSGTWRPWWLDTTSGLWDPGDAKLLAQLAVDSGSPNAITMWDAFWAARLGTIGRYEESITLGATATELYRRTGMADWEPIALSTQMLSMVELGRLDELLELASVQEAGGYDIAVSETTAWILTEYGLLDEASALASPVESIRDQPDDWMWLPNVHTAALVRAAVGDVEAAAGFRRLLEPFADRVAIDRNHSDVRFRGALAGAGVSRPGTTTRRLRSTSIRRSRSSRRWDHEPGWCGRSRPRAQITGAMEDHEAAVRLATELGSVPALTRLGEMG